MSQNVTVKQTRSAASWQGLVYLLFFGSGASGLVYEVVWTRQLTYLFGATIYAVATVLAAFMGGLALGSYAFGKIADRTARPLRLYGALEIGVAAAALMLPLLLRVLNPIFLLIYRHFESTFFVYSLLRFALTFAILLIPTTLMGGTLPILSRFIVRRRDYLGQRVGSLYSINTLGAVLGCFLAGFVLIASLGVHATTLLAACVNVAVGVVALGVSRRVERRGEAVPPTVQPEPSIGSGESFYSPAQVRWVLATYLVSGFAALAYEVAWTRALVFTFEEMKNTTYAFTAMLSVFLIGIALGSAFSSRIVDRQRDPLRLFGLLQLLIGLSGALSFFIIYYQTYDLHPFPSLDAQTRNIIWWGAVGNVFAKTAVAIFLPTFLMGMAFPVAARVCVVSLRRVGSGIGRLYSLNTIGAILGSFAAGFFLIPSLGIARTIAALALINVCLGVVILSINPRLTKNTKMALSAVGALIVLVLFVRIPGSAQFQYLSPTESLLFYKEGALATVAVVENSFGYKTLEVDNVGVAGTDRILLTDQKSLAHVPMLLLRQPRSALTVGFGSGGASWSYTRYSSLTRIDCVEICDTVLDAAPFLRESNHGVLEHPDARFRLIIDDVRSHLRFSPARYDIIATDCTDLRYKTNANLYDYEYFTLCKERLTDDGMVVVWMPLAGLSREAFQVALRTFYRAFPLMSVWYMNNEPTHYILIIGTKQPLQVDYALLKQRLAEPSVREDLAELFLDDADKLLSCFITDQQGLGNFLAGDTINTEDYPYLEFQSPKYGYNDQPIIDNLSALLRVRRDPTVVLVPGTFDAEAALRLRRFYDAVPEIVSGHGLYRNLLIPAACEAYLRAQAINPDDRALKNLLDFPELRLAVRAHPQNPWAQLTLGEVFFLQKRYGEALPAFRNVVDMDYGPLVAPDKRNELLGYQFRALEYIAESYEAAGQPDRAKEFFDRAAALKSPSSR